MSWGNKCVGLNLESHKWEVAYAMDLSQPILLNIASHSPQNTTLEKQETFQKSMRGVVQGAAMEQEDQ